MQIFDCDFYRVCKERFNLTLIKMFMFGTDDMSSNYTPLVRVKFSQRGKYFSTDDTPLG